MACAALLLLVTLTLMWLARGAWLRNRLRRTQVRLYATNRTRRVWHGRDREGLLNEAGGRAEDTKGECRGRRQIAYSDTGTTKPKIRTYMVVDERGCTPPARDVATGTFHDLIYQVNSSSTV